MSFEAPVLIALNEVFGDASAHADRDAIFELFLRPVVFLFRRKLLGESEGHAARNDRDLVNRVGVRKDRREERVAALVIRGDLLLLVGNDHALAFGAHEDLVLGVLELGHVHDFLIAARGEERRFINEVREIGSREARGRFRESRDFDVWTHGNLAEMNLEDPFASPHVGTIDDNPAVEAARTKERRIEHVGTVGRGDEDDALGAFEPVHFDEQLIQSLFALVVTAAETGAAMTTDRVDLVDEDDAGRALLALLEQVAHT